MNKNIDVVVSDDNFFPRNGELFWPRYLLKDSYCILKNVFSQIKTKPHFPKAFRGRMGNFLYRVKKKKCLFCHTCIFAAKKTAPLSLSFVLPLLMFSFFVGTLYSARYAKGIANGRVVVG